MTKQKNVNPWFQLGIIGKSGSGKSFLMNRIIEKVKTERVIIVDDLNQIQFKNRFDFFRCYSIDQFAEMIVDKSKFKIICSFQDFDDYDFLFALVWQLDNLLIAIDEITLFADSFNIDKYLLELIVRGRLKNISIIWNTQRPALINRTVFSQLTDLISLQMFDVRDIIYLPAKWKSKESAKIIESLDVGKYIKVMESGIIKNLV